MNGRSLSGLPRTLLFTLRARAEEQNQPAPLVVDPLAAEWFARVDAPQADSPAYNPIFQLATAVRAHTYDQITQNFLATRDGRSGETPLVVELGAGLSTRCYRLGLNQAHWVELDLPEAIAFRRLFDAENGTHTFLPYSMFDERWLDALPPHTPKNVLLIAEGVLFFLPPDEIARLFALVNGRLPGATFAFDAITHQFSPKARQHLADEDAPMQWLIPPDQNWGDFGLTVQQEWVITQQHMSRWQALGFDPAQLQNSRGNIITLAQLKNRD